MNNSRAAGSLCIRGKYTTSLRIYVKKFEPGGKIATFIKGQASITLNAHAFHRKTAIDKLWKSTYTRTALAVSEGLEVGTTRAHQTNGQLRDCPFVFS